jgi:OmpA-OmpF porin, OOP family
MSINLIDLAKQAMTPDLMSKAAGLLGESGDGTSKALSAALPMVLGGLASKSTSADGAAGLLGMITSGKTDGNMLGNLGSMLGGGEQSSGLMSMGTGLIGSLFGDKAGGMANALSSFAGIKSGSATGLMAIVGPMLMGLIGKHVGGMPGGASLGNLTSLLGGQKDHIAAAVPAGFGSLLGNVPGMGAATAAMSGITGAASGATAATAAAATAATAAATGGIGRIIPWLLGAAVIAGLGYYFLGRGKAPEPVMEAPVAEAPAAPMAGVDTCNKDFDTAMDGKAINFAIGKAVIAADSAALIDSLAKVATTCGTFKIEVAGHTDKTGDAAANKALSQARAAAVVAALAAKGVPAAQMTAVGFGAEKPLDPADTKEAYAKNRRIDFTVSQ